MKNFLNFQEIMIFKNFLKLNYFLEFLGLIDNLVEQWYCLLSGKVV